MNAGRCLLKHYTRKESRYIEEEKQQTMLVENTLSNDRKRTMRERDRSKRCEHQWAADYFRGENGLQMRFALRGLVPVPFTVRAACCDSYGAARWP